MQRNLRMKTTVTKKDESFHDSIRRYGDFNYVPIQLHLKPLIDFWLQRSDKTTPEYDYISKQLQDHPFLLEPVESLDLLQGHDRFLQLLFAPLVPRSDWTKEFMAVAPPFCNTPWLLCSKPYEDLHSGNHVFDLLQPGIGHTPVDTRLLYIYKIVLKKFYDLELTIEQPVIASCLNPETGLTRFFKLTGDTRFVEIESLGKLPEVDQGAITTLLDQPFDPDAWGDVLPIDQFLFRGLTILKLVDVTSEEATNRLQFSLLNPAQNNETEWFESVAAELRNIFRLPNLRLGVATIQGNGQLNFSSPRPLWNSLFLREAAEGSQSNYAGSWYAEVLNDGKTIIIEDLTEDKQANNTQVRDSMIAAGYHNLYLAPLFMENTLIGVLEMLNPDPKGLNGLSLYKLNQLKPIFAHALKRHAEEFENRVEAVMLEEFTSIHPKIQWKFREAAIGIIENRGRRTSDVSIVFHDLIPFYCSMDLRDSSKKRNLAILQDLHDNLEKVASVLRKAHALLKMNILDELRFQVEGRLELLRNDRKSADAQEISTFITSRVNPVVASLRSRDEQLGEIVSEYESGLCTETQICIKHRLAYEQALSLVNRYMIDFIQQKETALLQEYPCYIDTYQTDGLEYNIYLGQDITPNHGYDPLYIDELRLLQLQWTIEIIQHVDTMQPEIRKLLGYLEADDELTNALEIAPLLLAYDNRLTLKFRMNEKRLDVDGSYNVRYEIMKKRIDKATIRSTGERLTQPGHIALVYTRDADADAYIQHISYLAATQDLNCTWKRFELEPMSGVDGLKALRIKL